MGDSKKKIRIISHFVSGLTLLLSSPRDTMLETGRRGQAGATAGWTEGPWGPALSLPAQSSLSGACDLASAPLAAVSLHSKRTEEALCFFFF